MGRRQAEEAEVCVGRPALYSNIMITRLLLLLLSTKLDALLYEWCSRFRSRAQAAWNANAE